MDDELKTVLAQLVGGIGSLASIVDALTVAQTGLSAKVDALTVAQTGLSARVDASTVAQTGLSAKVDALTVAQTGLSAKVDALTVTQAEHGTKIDLLIEDLRGVKADGLATQAGIRELKHTTSANHFKLTGSIDRVASMLAEHMADYDMHIPFDRKRA